MWCDSCPPPHHSSLWFWKVWYVHSLERRFMILIFYTFYLANLSVFQSACFICKQSAFHNTFGRELHTHTLPPPPHTHFTWRLLDVLRICQYFNSPTWVSVTWRTDKTGNVVWHSVVASACQQCCRGRTISILYSECVSVTLLIQHAMSMLRIILSSVPCLNLIFLSILSRKTGRFSETVNEHTMWFDFLYNFCLKHFSL